MTKSSRLLSVDVYRGFVMLLMMAEVLQFEKVYEAIPESGFWSFLAFHQSHVTWVGCSLHDLIQPSFSFLVGVVLPFSILKRIQSAGFQNAFFHALKRSLILIALGIFLRSQYKIQTYFTFEDTLTQIGLGYPFLFLLGRANYKSIITVLVIILLGYFMLFAFNSIPSTLGPESSMNLKGFAAHWNKFNNPAMAFDQWFLNLFPRKEPFEVNKGGYVTLSFVPTLATMILGLLAGKILNSDISKIRIFKKFLIIGIGCILAGFILDYLGICPIVKRIWTPSWVLFSGGWCFILMAIFYGIIDLWRKNKWTYFLNVIGMNSIAAYVIAHTIDSFISQNLFIHLGPEYSHFLGDDYSSIIHGGLILVFEWLILNWMFKKGLFLKV